MMPSSRPKSSLLVCGTVAIGLVGLLFLFHRPLHKREDEAEVSSPRLSEEDGDDDAKTVSRESETSSTGRETLHEAMKQAGGELSVKPIGVVRSVYRLCVGTPRQGLLAPHSRGRIELTSAAAEDAVDGLEGYSHVWILFVFHLNTTGKKRKDGSSSAPPAKIAPPALGGRRIGVLATRSPHRLNPVGITLVHLRGIRTIRKKGPGKKQKQITCVDVDGLDLVDGTPVLDIKPYVHNYDSPLDESECSIPSWVSGGLSLKRSVTFSDEFRQQLQTLVHQHPAALEFYGETVGETPEECFRSVCCCIEEVLAMDVRSRWQTSKVRTGKFRAEQAQRLQHVAAATEAGHKDDGRDTSVCTQQIDNLLVKYTIFETKNIERAASEGSGAEDKLVVKSVQLIESRNKRG